MSLSLLGRGEILLNLSQQEETHYCGFGEDMLWVSGENAHLGAGIANEKTRLTPK